MAKKTARGLPRNRTIARSSGSGKRNSESEKSGRSASKRSGREKPLTKVEEYYATDTEFAQGPVHWALKTYLGYCLYKAAQRMRFLFNQRLSVHNIAAVHFGVLVVLLNSESMSQVTLGTEMGIDKASMVKLIDDLEKQGLVIRLAKPGDRRVKLVEITDKGKSLMKQMDSCRSECEKTFLKDLNDEERDMLKKLVPKLVR